MESNADVLIIGGGPAGSTLACLLAAGNHNVIIVEKAVHPRAHVGELLTPSVNSVLHRIDLLNQMEAAGFVRRYGVAWSAPGVTEKPTTLIPVAEHPPPRALRRYGFNVERDAFDAMLLHRARQLGVRVMERTIVRRVVFENDRVTGVELQNARGSVKVVSARFVADASGRTRLLARQLELLEHRTVRRQCAMYAWFRGIPPVGGECGSQGFVYLHILRDCAWGWQIPLRGDLTSIGLVAPCDRFQKHGRDEDVLFASMIEQNRTFNRVYSYGKRDGAWRVVPDFSYGVQRLYGRGWLLLGDAAGFIDPIFSSGVDIAMYSAVFAYEAILPLLLLGKWSDHDERFALSHYELRLHRGLAVWSRAVDLFYAAPRDLRRLAREQSLAPAICRFLQGNPYEVQNQQIFEGLLSRLPRISEGG